MTAQDIMIAFGGISTAVAGFFLRECYLMLKKNTADIAQMRSEIVEVKVRLKDAEEKLKIFRT